MALLHGIDRTSANAANVTSAGTIVYQSGIPLLANGDIRTTAITGAPPAGSRVVKGVSYASDGTLQTTTDAIGLVVGGVAYTAARVLCVTANAPDNNSKGGFIPTVGFVLVDSTGRVHVA